MKCKNCKFWRSGGIGDDNGLGFNKTNQSWGFCSEAESEKPASERLFASICQAEDIGGELVTRDVFGCIEFTVKLTEG